MFHSEAWQRFRNHSCAKRRFTTNDRPHGHNVLPSKTFSTYPQSCLPESKKTNATILVKMGLTHPCGQQFFPHNPRLSIVSVSKFPISPEIHTNT